MRCAVLLSLLMLGATAGPNAAAAQMSFEGVEGSIGFVGWSGHDFRALEDGFRFSVAPLLRVGRAWRVGVEAYAGDVDFERTSVDHDLSIHKRGDEIGINAVVRRSFGDPDGRHLYLQLRTGWSELDTEVVAPFTPDPRVDDDLVESFSTTGFAVGPEVGVSFAASGSLRVLLGAGFTWNRYGNTRIFGPFDFSYGERTTAIRWGIRTGVMLRNPFGKSGNGASTATR